VFLPVPELRPIENLKPNGKMALKKKEVKKEVKMEEFREIILGEKTIR